MVPLLISINIQSLIESLDYPSISPFLPVSHVDPLIFAQHNQELVYPSLKSSQQNSKHNLSISQSPPPSPPKPPPSPPQVVVVVVVFPAAPIHAIAHTKANQRSTNVSVTKVKKQTTDQKAVIGVMNSVQKAYTINTQKPGPNTIALFSRSKTFKSTL